MTFVNCTVVVDGKVREQLYIPDIDMGSHSPRDGSQNIVQYTGCFDLNGCTSTTSDSKPVKQSIAEDALKYYVDSISEAVLTAEVHAKPRSKTLKQSIMDSKLNLKIPSLGDILGPGDLWTNVELNTGYRWRRVTHYGNRRIFDPRQKELLEQIFKRHRDPPSEYYPVMADYVGLPEKRVRTWFRQQRKTEI